MLAITRREHDTATLVERPQPNPVFLVERLLAHWHNNLLLPLTQVEQCATVRVLERRRRIRPEPCALLGYDGAVALEKDKHKRVELPEVRSVGRVPRRGHFVIDRREEMVRLKVLRQLGRVAIILRLCRRSKKMSRACFFVTYLHEVLLRPFVVHSGARRVAHELAEHVERLAWGYVCDAHVLRTEGEEITDRRVVVSLDVCAQKLPA